LIQQGVARIIIVCSIAREAFFDEKTVNEWLERIDTLRQAIQLSEPDVGVEIRIRAGGDRERAHVKIRPRAPPGQQPYEVLYCVHGVAIVRPARARCRHPHRLYDRTFESPSCALPATSPYRTA